MASRTYRGFLVKLMKEASFMRLYYTHLKGAMLGATYYTGHIVDSRTIYIAGDVLTQLLYDESKQRSLILEL